MNTVALGFTKWIIKMILLLAFFAGASVMVAHCQNKIIAPPYYNHEEHKDREDMEEDIRFKSVFVIATEPTTIFWKKETKDLVSTGSFTFDDRSRVGKNVQKGCYIAIYCITHNYLYALYPCKE